MPELIIRCGYIIIFARTFLEGEAMLVLGGFLAHRGYLDIQFEIASAFTSFLIAIWIALNILAYIRHWDPYPFILLNLFLSLQAAYTAPVLMMSQNRLAEKDRIEAHNDYNLNVKSEQEIRVILEHLDAQNNVLNEILKKIAKSK